jgi:deoxycytidylate deaminase
MNAIMNALDSRQLEGSTLYITILPCYDCLKQLANLGLARIVYLTDYARVTPDGKAESEKEVWELAQLADIEIVKYEGRKG